MTAALAPGAAVEPCPPCPLTPQAYADVGLLLSNQDLMDAAAKLGAGGAGGGGLSDVNRLAAQCLAGFLWPLDGQEALGAGGRIRDTVRGRTRRRGAWDHVGWWAWGHVGW